MNYPGVTTLLLARIPEFESFYRELLDDFGDDTGLGTHIVVGGLFTFLKEQLRSQSEVEPILTKVLCFVEEMASSKDAEVQNLAVISFLEHMGQLTNAEKVIVIRRLGPASRHFLS